MNNRYILERAFEERLITQEQLQNGKLELEITPNHQGWIQFIYKILASSAILFLLAGIIFFFAFNWDSMHKFLKLGSIAFLFISLLGLVIIKNENQLIQDLGSLAISIIVGVYFAVFGQIYQTGADAYELFIAWTLLITPISLISKFQWQWFSYFVLIQLTVFLYLTQVLRNDNVFKDYPVIFSSLSLCMLIISEFLATKYDSFQNRIVARILIFVGLGSTTFMTVLWITNNYDFGSHYFFIYLLSLVTIMSFYFFKKQDLYALTLSLLSLMAFFTSLFIKAIDMSNFILMFFLIGFMLILMGLGSGFTLLYISKYWKQKKAQSE